MSTREEELEKLLADARASNRVLHRRVQHAEAKRPARMSRGRARLAQDCVALAAEVERLKGSLGQVRAIAAGWGRQAYPPEHMLQQSLKDVAEIAEQALGNIDPKQDPSQ